MFIAHELSDGRRSEERYVPLINCQHMSLLTERT
jgi:hypothetical protein